MLKRMGSVCIVLFAMLAAGVPGFGSGRSGGVKAAFTASTPERWVGTWATAPFDGDPWHTIPALADSTLREIVHTSIAGKELRITFTNEFGTQPLRIDAATVALSAGGSNIQPSSLHGLTFGGSPSIVLLPGALAVSDPVAIATSAFSDLAISMYLPRQNIGGVSVHTGADQDNYIQIGNAVSAPSLSSAEETSMWFFLKGVEVMPAAPDAAAVVAFGDSITDGAWVPNNTNERWPDDLAVRLHSNPATAHLSVLNEGIGGNCVQATCAGPNALARFDRDVLAQPGVKFLMILESINDIGDTYNPNLTENLEQGLSQLVARAHEHGIKVLGATLTPYQGAGYYSENGEKVREQVNAWIRSSGVFDGVVDFDKAVRNPDKPLCFKPVYDSGDHLHPNVAGYKAMADAIDLSFFR